MDSPIIESLMSVKIVPLNRKYLIPATEMTPLMYRSSWKEKKLTIKNLGVLTALKLYFIERRLMKTFTM